MTSAQTARWLLIGLLLGTAPGTTPGASEREAPGTIPGSLDIAKGFMTLYYTIQEADSADMLHAVEKLMTRALEKKQMDVDTEAYDCNTTRKKKDKLTSEMQWLHIQMATDYGTPTFTLLEAQLNAMQAEYGKLEDAYKTKYATYIKARGEFAAIKIMVAVLQKEVLKRLKEMDAGLVWGTWAGTYSVPDIKEPFTTGGAFSLKINRTSGAVSGTYQNGEENVPLSGTYDPQSGNIAGIGTGKDCTVQWSGRMTIDPKTKTLCGSGKYGLASTINEGKGGGTWKTN